MNTFELVLGVVFLVAALIRLKTNWAPWPLRVSLWPLRLDVSEEKKKEAERLTAVVCISFSGFLLLVFGLDLLG